MSNEQKAKLTESLGKESDRLNWLIDSGWFPTRWLAALKDSENIRADVRKLIDNEL